MEGGGVVCRCRKGHEALQQLKRAKPHLCVCSLSLYLNVKSKHKLLGQRQRNSILILSAVWWLCYHRNSLFISRTDGRKVLGCHRESLWGHDRGDHVISHITCDSVKPSMEMQQALHQSKLFNSHQAIVWSHCVWQTNGLIWFSNLKFTWNSSLACK